MAKVNIDKEAFVKAWVEEELSLSEMAERFGISDKGIWQRVKRLGLQRDRETSSRVLKRCNTRRKSFDDEELKRFYLDEKHSLRDTAKHFGCAIPTVQRRIRELGIERTHQESREQVTKLTLLRKYGTDDVNKIPGVREKWKQTMLKNHGTTNFWEIPESVESYRRTSLKNWGTENPSQSDVIKDKVKETHRQKYGVDYFPQSEKYKQKIQETLNEKYGVSAIAHIPGLQKRIRETFKENHEGISNPAMVHLSKETLEIISSEKKFEQFILSSEDKTVVGLSKALNCSTTCVKKRVEDYNLKHLISGGISYPETELKRFIASLGFICYKTREIIPPREIDVYCPSVKIGFEFNGRFWHSNEAKGEYYHQEKSLAALRKHAFIYHIFEDEWEQQRGLVEFEIKRLLRTKESFDIKDCVVHFDEEEYPEELSAYLILENRQIMQISLWNEDGKWWIYAYYNYYSYNFRAGLCAMLKAIREVYGIKEIYANLYLAKENPVDFLTIGFDIVEITKPELIKINKNFPTSDCGRLILKYEGLEF